MERHVVEGFTVEVVEGTATHDGVYITSLTNENRGTRVATLENIEQADDLLVDAVNEVLSEGDQ